MSTFEQNEKLAKVCSDVQAKFEKINADGRFNDIISKLEYVIVSYHADKNPVGLFEIGEMALRQLKAYKEEKPKQVAQKLIDDLEKALSVK
ncbi:MAG: hypothetical protein NZM38_08170 [Cytophagales bacterium]|nr:hypothetical protein [Cytophagales bacterium]MDW8384732.1 hypothetical protein [Flammeovirgaceae bacterium]